MMPTSLLTPLAAMGSLSQMNAHLNAGRIAAASV